MSRGRRQAGAEEMTLAEMRLRARLARALKRRHLYIDAVQGDRIDRVTKWIRTRQARR